VAMYAGDKTRYGGYPALLANDLNIKTFGKDRDSQTFHAVCELMLGLKEVADENNYVMYKGETAEMGAVCLFGQPAGNAYVHLVRDGLRLCSSQECNYGKERESRSKDVALREKGLRANGGSSMRKAFSMCFGDNWYIQEAARPYIELAATPSVLYDKFLVHMNGWSSPDLTPIVKSSLIVHLTGGSFRGKFWEDFLKRHGFSAVLDDLYDPPEIMQLGGEWRGFKSSGFYDTFHGGQGVIVVMDKEDVGGYIRLAAEAGHEAKECGMITSNAGKPQLIIESKFKKGETVTIGGK